MSVEQNEEKWVKYNTPLRQAQRDLTRQRIKGAARDLFYERHYDSTTMDHIAVAAGLRRSTLYLHYKDKAEILAEIVDDYTPRAQEVLSSLPGPSPTITQVQKWLKKICAFMVEERVPLSIIVELKGDQNHLATLDQLMSGLIAALGTHNPRFAKAADPQSDPAERALGILLFQEMTFVCEQVNMRGNDALSKALVNATAQKFVDFLVMEMSSK